jgi:hypothetical protein
VTTQLGLDGSEIVPTELERRTHRGGKPPLANPLLPIFGPGPAGATCGSCDHLVARRLARTYYKCELRSLSGSASTDHRVRWPACGRFVEGGGSLVVDASVELDPDGAW